MAESQPLWEVYRAALAGAIFTDLTHAFHPGQPRFSAFPDEERQLLFDHAKGDTFQVHRYAFAGQWGTHVDPPVHCVKGGRAVDDLPVTEMLLPLVVLDIRERVATSADATPELADLTAWEERHGRIPAGCFVALRTGWSSRWPDSDRFYNRSADGIAHTPGWSGAVLKELFERRGITAIGHEQIDTDPGQVTSRGDFTLEQYVLSRDRWQIELLTNLDALPEAGALIMASWPKAKGGSGFPARAIAIHR